MRQAASVACSKVPSWEDYSRNKIILLDAYQQERLPFPQDWLLVLERVVRR
jgi:hypothetical protein